MRPRRSSEKKASYLLKLKTKTKKNCGPWKSGNPKTGFPLFHRPECLRRKEKRPFTQNA
jgi:hypothetical protein